jgi:hypothetical protein
VNVQLSGDRSRRGSSRLGSPLHEPLEGRGDGVRGYGSGQLEPTHDLDRLTLGRPEGQLPPVVRCDEQPVAREVVAASIEMR